MSGMATIAYPLIVAVAGALAFGFSSNGKVVRLGEIAFFVGLLWTVCLLAGARVHF
jgi:hypothetical protein